MKLLIFLGGASGDYGTWGNTWINAHAAVQKSLNKPVILEEFGVTTNQTAGTFQFFVLLYLHPLTLACVKVYNTWWSTVVSSGLAGDLIWYVLPALHRQYLANTTSTGKPGLSSHRTGTSTMVIKSSPAIPTTSHRLPMPLLSRLADKH